MRPLSTASDGPGSQKDLPTEAVGRVFALGFVTEQFQRNLKDLLSRTREAQGADT